MLNYLSKSVIPIIFLLIITYGMFKGRKVYEWFIEGAKEGLMVTVRIFPYLLAMIIAVQIFKEANLMNLLNNLIEPLGNLIGLPKELIPLIIVKPLSGSGAIGVFTDIIKNVGADTRTGYNSICSNGKYRNYLLYNYSLLWCSKGKKNKAYFVGSNFGGYYSNNYGHFYG